MYEELNLLKERTNEVVMMCARGVVLVDEESVWIMSKCVFFFMSNSLDELDGRLSEVEGWLWLIDPFEPNYFNKMQEEYIELGILLMCCTS